MIDLAEIAIVIIVFGLIAVGGIAMQRDRVDRFVHCRSHDMEEDVKHQVYEQQHDQDST